MTVRTLTRDDVKAAVIGGKFLGGGGGGWEIDGLRLGELAMSQRQPDLVSIDELDPNDIVITAALVGAPAAKARYVETSHFLRTVELLQSQLDRTIAGIITNENGAAATVNGWIQAANFRIPIVDAPCNGRAHPTGVMGSIGLQQVPDYISLQAAAGGKDSDYVELVGRGSLVATSSLIRSASIQAGGLVAVARNPVTAEYVRNHAALGGLSQAIALGYRMLDSQGKGGKTVIRETLSYLDGQSIVQGMVDEAVLRTEGGFDVGTLRIGDFDLTFWNEYMTLDRNGSRLATFPDLIMTVDAQTGFPVTTAEIQVGQFIEVVLVPAQNLKLGAGMRDANLYLAVEDAVKRELIPYVFS